LYTPLRGVGGEGFFFKERRQAKKRKQYLKIKTYIQGLIIFRVGV